MNFRPDKPRKRDWIPVIIWAALITVILIAAYFATVVSH